MIKILKSIRHYAWFAVVITLGIIAWPFAALYEKISGKRIPWQ